MTDAIDTSKLDLIIASLDGQCLHDIEHFCRVHDVDYDGLTKADHEYIDAHVFNCEACGWWCDTDQLSERDDGLVCVNCVEGR